MHCLIAGLIGPETRGCAALPQRAPNGALPRFKTTRNYEQISRPSHGAPPKKKKKNKEKSKQKETTKKMRRRRQLPGRIFFPLQIPNRRNLYKLPCVAASLLFFLFPEKQKTEETYNPRAPPQAAQPPFEIPLHIGHKKNIVSGTAAGLALHIPPETSSTRRGSSLPRLHSDFGTLLISHSKKSLILAS